MFLWDKDKNSEKYSQLFFGKEFMHLRKILDIDNQFFTNSDLIVFLKWDSSAVSYLSSIWLV